MGLNLFLLLCLNGGLVPVAILQTVHEKYIFTTSSMTWAAGQSYCRVMYDDLATIQGDTDMLTFKKEAASNGLKASAWVGLYNDINSWRWSLNKLSVDEVPYSNWGPSQPDNAAGKQSCAVIDKNSLWWDADCSEQKPFMCYDAKFSGDSRFIAVSSSMLNWSEAQTYCRKHHTDLASALNSSDNNIIVQLMTTLQIYPWFGLYRDSWKWSDGTIATDLPWDSGAPDNFGGSQNCAVINNGLFNDVSCTKLYYVVCQTLRKQKIVRLQMKADESGFMSEMQSIIIQQMKQKLKEHGMLENTTVTWRVQPDGNIFKKKNKDDL
ncbi:C-type mannose receptor 2-like [Tachysurus vachellii]|uniref:C-type mannose receptor 2-like n=1 Tax=Tachysurus vachellii TaxID=175792 RepID=UPI00296AD172|nr:C-type mannose receptor 2-like [Tachysurus vachellii]XP_060720065.1 C-type mannose receptor 2-like [Tachysurus vachellii]XP_060720066.1 C-type mannose receptor 2-like [Tachysurus vachellii]XP_060720067.1 C-type mannose receptor 2-like [Tachysurus vachellii]XP_060720068.1 C-type mannose receptor 2-like [Tachysurus vachellii]XP_060720069.1 C-type mannose receptor 2-like [Tachysurus vachellii]XP_060720070.1 C-type mannose receptor 2-like [Tachysurus vachellii]